MFSLPTIQATPQALVSVVRSSFVHTKRGSEPRVITPAVMEESEFNEIFNEVETGNYHSRLETFSKGNWLQECPLSVAELALSGFCSTGIRDKVVCFSCKGKVAGWCALEVPNIIHAEVYPTCQFIQPIFKEIEKLRRGSGTQFDLVQTGAAKREEVSSTSLGYSESAMVFYASEFNRLMSFSEWPLKNPVDRYDLAATGFIWPDERKEQTVCVGCGLEVKEWGLGDMPERRHAAESPKCPFVVKKEGSNREMDNIEKLQYVTRGVTANE